MNQRKHTHPRIRTLNHMLWLAFPILALPFAAVAETGTDFSNRALSGVTKTYGPNVTLALSVEFPTAGAAYSNNTTFNTASMNEYYEGYFDNKKCYRYVSPTDRDGRRAFDASGYSQDRGNGPDGLHLGWSSFYSGKYNDYFLSKMGDQNAIDEARLKEFFHWDQEKNKDVDLVQKSDALEYFEPVGYASTSGSMVGICNGADEFSGNFMNWASMTAIDIFRQAMTGGNRALGINSAPANYLAGDTSTQTFLRRANVVRKQNSSYAMRREVNLTPEQIKMILPHDYAIADGTVLEEKSRETAANTLFLYKGYLANRAYTTFFGSPRVYTYRAGSVKQEADGSNPRLYVRNVGFGIDIRRKVWERSNQYYSNGFAYYAPIKNRIMPYHVSVMACKNGMLESNCAQQANNNYKPTGLMQKNASDMRFATLGYANVRGNGINGGILRSRMRYIIDPRSNSSEVAPKYQQEINPQTGQFYPNPDRNAENKQDAFTLSSDKESPSANFGNSGSINYLNKFGDGSGYKTNDPGAELYYTALRYLRNKGFPAEYDSFQHYNGTNGVISQGGLTASERDNFPVITAWDNPLEVYSNSSQTVSAENVCRPNYLIFIGDTNTHHDHKLPGGWDGTVADDINVKTELQKIIQNEQNSGAAGALDFNLNSMWGSNTSYVALPALAYWAHTNPLQSGFNKSLTTFMIDVVEHGNYKTGYNPGNTYYLAAKYGGFDENDSVEGTNKNKLPDVDSEWARSSNQVDAFTQAGKGTPKTFSVANTPIAMVQALNNAFNSTATAENPSSTGLSSVKDGAVVEAKDSVILLQSAYRDTTKTDTNGKKHRVYAGDVLALEAKLNSSKLTFNTKWSADTLLRNKYHNADGWYNRKVFTRTAPNNAVIAFNTTNASVLQSSLGKGTDAASLISYVLGDNRKEGSTYRERYEHLMGTVIHSTVVPISKRTAATVTAPARTCTYPETANITTRADRYVVAANDGMTYVLDENGQELASYLPSTALPKLADYASTSYNHFFLNDGMAASKEVCITGGENGARTIVIGGSGRGGNSVYALDLTSPTAVGAENMLWEFTHESLGLSPYAPIITHDRTGVPIAIISGGYNPSAGDEGYIFVLRLDKAAGTPWREDTNVNANWSTGNWYRIQLGKAGVGELFGMTRATTNSIDDVYAGDLNGYLWRLNQNSTGRFEAAYVRNNKAAPIFKADTPIVGAPYVSIVYGKPYVVFSTGRYFGDNDLPNSSKTLQNYAYGIIEGNITKETTLQSNGALIANSTLLEQNIKEEAKKGTGTQASTSFYDVTDNAINKATQNGWRLRLPQNWLSVDRSLIIGNQVARFSAFNPLANDASSDLCSTSGGATYMTTVNLFNGGKYRKPVYDTNGDGSYDSQDTVYSTMAMSGTTPRLLGSVSLNAEKPASTEGDKKKETCYAAVNTSGEMGTICSDAITAAFSIRRISWRELF